MIVWLLLVGIIAYFIVRQSAVGITRANVGVLWLVMMFPALVWTAWGIARGPTVAMPLWLALPPFILSPLVYLWLVKRGRSPLAQPPTPPGEPVAVGADPTSPSEAELLARVAAGAKPPPPLLDRTEEARLRDCFPWSVFYLNTVEQRPQAALCFGNLRAAPEVAYRTVLAKVREQFNDRFLVMFQEGHNGKPFFALVPNPTHASAFAANGSPPLSLEGPLPPILPLGHPASDRPLPRLPQAALGERGPAKGQSILLALALLALTLVTTTLMGAIMALRIRDTTLPTELPIREVLSLGLPYGVALVAILSAREAGRWWAAHRRGISTSLPYLIPLPAFLGTLGAYLHLKSPAPDRKALFDLGFFGAALGLAVSLPVLWWGLRWSTVVVLPQEAGLANLRAIVPEASLGLALLAKTALGSSLSMGKAIALHPLAIAGYVGWWLTVFHLLPIGALDGGRILHAMLGTRGGAIAGQVARFLLLAVALVRPELLLLALLAFFLPSLESPPLDGVSPLDNRRDFLGLVAMAVLAVSIVPAPRGLLGWF